MIRDTDTDTRYAICKNVTRVNTHAAEIHSVQSPVALRPLPPTTLASFVCHP